MPEPADPPGRYEWEDYLYPPNDAGIQVLRNKRGLTNLTEALNSERQLTAGRQIELAARPALVTRTFDTDHWKAIHRHVFQDVYVWAGQFRTVDIAKGDHGFLPESQLEGYASAILDQIRAADMFAGRDRAGVVDGLVRTMQALNIIHPFREGNGRTQRILTEHIAEHAGYLLDWYRIDPVEQNLIMALAFDGELEPLRDAVEGAVLPIIRGGSTDTSPWPTQPTGPDRAPNFWRLTRTGEQVLSEARATPSRPDPDAAPARNVGAQPQHEHGR